MKKLVKKTKPKQSTAEAPAAAPTTTSSFITSRKGLGVSRNGNFDAYPLTIPITNNSYREVEEYQTQRPARKSL